MTILLLGWSAATGNSDFTDCSLENLITEPSSTYQVDEIRSSC